MPRKKANDFQNPNNPSFIDPIWNNKIRSLQNSSSIDRRLSDFYKTTALP